MVCIVETQAPHNANLLSCQGWEQVLHGQDVVRDLRRRVERRAENLIRFDGLFLVECEADCAHGVRSEAKNVARGLTILVPVYGLPEVHLRGLRRNEANETSPLLDQSEVSDCLLSWCKGCSPS